MGGKLVFKLKIDPAVPIVNPVVHSSVPSENPCLEIATGALENVHPQTGSDIEDQRLSKRYLLKWMRINIPLSWVHHTPSYLHGRSN